MKPTSLTTLLSAIIALPAAAATTFFFDPATPYLSFDDSPFKTEVLTGWVFEDFQDGTIDLGPNATATAGYTVFLGGQGGLSDSVEFTTLNELSNQGGTLFGSGIFTLTFAVPTTHAGLVWTDGQTGSITFEAFDADGVSLGSRTGNHADGSITGTTGEDRFYGVFHSEGISRITITSAGAGQELDHLQFGGAVPEPSVALLFGLSALAFFRRSRRPISIC